MAARQVTLTLPEDLYDRMAEKGLKPSAILQEALELALSGADQRSLADRLDKVEREIRTLKRVTRLVAGIRRDLDSLVGSTGKGSTR